MQKLSEIFEQLTQGELSQVSLGGGEMGVIDEANYRKLGNHVQLGLTALYKRFNLKQGKLMLQLFPDQEDYPLQNKFAVTGKNNLPRRWILDSALSPFNNDIIKIFKVTCDSGKELAINNYADDFSVFTPTMESLRIPKLIVEPSPNLTPDQYKTSKLKVEYQANHGLIVPRSEYFNPSTTIVELPASHTQALLYFVASRVHNPIGMGQEFNAGNNWAQRYELECRRLEDDGNEIDDGNTNTRAKQGGWI